MSNDNDDGFLVHAPPNEMAKAEAVYVIVSVDANGGEGMCGMMTDTGWLPAVFLHPRLIEPTLTLMRRAAKQTGRHQKLRVLRFPRREVLKEVDTTTEERSE